MQTLIVYRGHDNTVECDMTRYDEATRKWVPITFPGVTRMVLIFDDPTPAIVFDTAQLPGTIVWTAGGHITFNISEYDIPVGVYGSKLVTYTAATPEGVVVVDDDPINGRQLSFEVRGHAPDGLPPPLIPTGGVILQRNAGEVLSALRVVYESQGAVYVINPGILPAPVDQIVGITLTAAGSVGVQVAIRTQGTIDDPGWNWTEGLVYVGPGGILTQTYPTTGWEIVVGSAPSPTRLNIDFDEPVLLA